VKPERGSALSHRSPTLTPRRQTMSDQIAEHIDTASEACVKLCTWAQ
jgi:hypothetical protein